MMSVNQRLKQIANNPNTRLIDMCELISFYWSSSKGIVVHPSQLIKDGDLESILATYNIAKELYQ